MTRYWGEGDVMVIAGMSSTGKTNLALQMTCFNGIETLYFGVDMSDKGIAKRLWEIDWYRKAHAIYPEYYDNNEVRAMCEKAFRKAVMDNEVEVPENIQVWDSDNMSLDQIEFESRQKLKEKKYGALIIDYATRLDIGSEKDLWRAEQKAMRGIKAMAKRLKIPVIALSQFNKEAKPYMKPEYSWLSGSSELFSSSDIVLAIWLSKNADGTADQNKLNLSDDLKNRDAGVHGDTILNRYGLWLTQGSDF
jgi:replicative DNA helicase